MRKLDQHPHPVALVTSCIFLAALFAACSAGGPGGLDAGPDAADADGAADGDRDIDADDGADGGGDDGGDTIPGCDGRYVWTVHPGNPVIAWQDFLPDTFWNDPSVLRESEGYRMWLSGGDPNADPIRVAIYHARSADGLTWELDPAPVLEPGDPGAWDSERIETPDVVLVDGTYHLYYSGCGAGCGADPAFAIGHATSADGRHWTKDPANPVLRHQQDDPLAWGAVGANEPAVIHNSDDGLFSLYYAGIKFDDQDPTIGRIGVLLATSPDGSQFTHLGDANGQRRLILTRDIPGAASGAWFGYASPGAVRTATGRVHLFCGFVVAPGGPATARSVAIAHARSDDGVTFDVLDETLLEAGQGDWLDQNVRAATALEEDGSLKLWFAGDTQTPSFSEGIGHAAAVCE